MKRLILFGWLAFQHCGISSGQEWTAPAIEDSVSIRDGRSGQVIQFSEMLDCLAKADVVFLGETHNDETTHRVELAVYQGLLGRRDNKTLLAMEMFERDVQSDLNAYLAGEIDEATFLAKSRPWGNYMAAYRPLIELAKKTGVPVVASNFPRPLIMKLAMQGQKALEQLPDGERAQAPREFHPNTPAYWRRADNAIRGHLQMMRSQQGDDERLYSTQSLWDNAMGEACGDALDKFPDHLVLHINGGFHSEYWDGTVHQLKVRKPDAKVLTVSILPSTDPSTARLIGAPVADFVVFAERRATDLNDGKWSVYVNRENDYRLELPDSATEDSPVPLLIWLSDDGLTASDGLEIWKARLGDNVAIAALEPPYREIQEDFSVGGRWFWPDTFSSDIGAMVESTERIWGYILRHYPIDPKRVCIAGEGTGATVAAAVALLTDRMSISGVAIEPRKYSKIKDFPLPLLEDWGQQQPPKRTLSISGDNALQNWWGSELKEYEKIGMGCEFVVADEDPWQHRRQSENLVRQHLGLESIPITGQAAKAYILIENESPRARHWSRLAAQKASASDQTVDIVALTKLPTASEAKPISLEISAKQFSERGALPRCPGPFGGTTVVVLPAAMPADEQQRWMELEKNDPLNRSSRFHRLRIATTGDQNNLAQVLKELLAENRKNVLIVPAVFCADATLMRPLGRAARDYEDEMTLQWLPGLGGQLK
jgi:uncharacterized iron-regulated protein